MHEQYGYLGEEKCIYEFIKLTLKNLIAILELEMKKMEENEK